jgi:SapC
MSAAAGMNATPLFYRRIRMLDRTRDQAMRLLPSTDCSFAAATNAIPLVADEFFLAEQNYPIVFAGNDALYPVAVVGLRATDNLFVDADGTWRADSYVPLYIRRHPFILIDGNDGRLHLGIDDAAPRWSVETGQPLFEVAEPTRLTSDAFDFCTRFYRQHAVASAFAAALREHGVLAEYRFNVTAAGLAHSVTGCHVVSEEKLAAVPDDVFLGWRRAGWLPLITAHLLSLRNWQALGRIAAERPAAALAA